MIFKVKDYGSCRSRTDTRKALFTEENVKKTTQERTAAAPPVLNRDPSHPLRRARDIRKTVCSPRPPPPLFFPLNQCRGKELMPAVKRFLRMFPWFCGLERRDETDTYNVPSAARPRKGGREGAGRRGRGPDWGKAQ